MNYVQELEKVAKSEWASLIFWAVVLLAITVIVWIANYFYFKKQFQKHKTPARIKRTQDDYKKSKWACLALSVIIIAIGGLFSLGTISTVRDINKDIQNESFKTYNGGYFVESGLRTKAYPRVLRVYLDNGEVVYIHNRNFIEYLKVDSGDFDGKIVYGENSLIVVEMDSRE